MVKVNSNYTTDTKSVLDKWKTDFEDLHNKPSQIDNYDIRFYQEILQQKTFLEQPLYLNFEISNDPLNKPIMYDEVEKVLNKLKSNKLAGWDNIPYEVIKNKSIYLLLVKYFQKCFDSSFVPSIWLKSVVSPIPKSGTKDPHTPLNYRGISLLSCLSKVTLLY